MLPPADRWSSVGCGLGQISASKDLAPVSSGPGAFLLTQMVKDLLAMRKTLVQSLSGEDPLEKGMATYSNILNPLQFSRLENSVDRGAWPTTVPGGSKNGTGLSDQHLPFPLDMEEMKLSLARLAEV